MAAIRDESMISGSRVFLGNFDNGVQVPRRVFVPNNDGASAASAERITGHLALKCMEVAPRAAHLIDREDAAVLYTPLADEYAEYCHGLYGFTPRVFAPSRQYTDLSEPLSLLEWILGDEELLHVLAHEGRACKWRLDAFIDNPLVYAIGDRTGIPVMGMSREAVERGAVGDLNDKALFQLFCRENGIDTPNSTHVTGWDDLLSETTRQYELRGSVMIRHSRTVGGLGNREVNERILAEAGCRTVSEYLAKFLESQQEWRHETILVEPVLEIGVSPTTLFWIGDDGRPHLIAVADQVVEKMSFLGSVFPARVDDNLQARMIAGGMAYGLEFYRRGGRGYYDVDWGVCRDGRLVAFESNGRYTGNNHPIMVMERLGQADAMGCSKDALRVHPSTRFQDVVAFLGSRKAAWNVDRQDGVVVTIPPAGLGDVKTMGYVAIGATRERVHELQNAMDEFALGTFRRGSVMSSCKVERSASRR
jgi:hypothetical protein